MAFVKAHLKIKNTVISVILPLRLALFPGPAQVSVTGYPQIASQAISAHLKPIFLLRSMLTQPLDNASNSFSPKLKILDRTLSSQNMRGQTLHNRLSIL